jgi:SAM-dependent methyltransferase
MIELARRRRPAANVAYRTGDLLEVAGRFDLVFCAAALHDLPALDPALAHIRSLLAPGGKAIIADVVAPFSPMPRWYFRAAAAVYLPVDLLRRHHHAIEIYPLDTDPAWIAHLATDRYSSRAQFERCYARHFPGATFQRARHLHVCSWNAP